MTSFGIINAIEVPRGMLILTGVWPFENPSIWYRIKKIISYSASVIFLISMALEVTLSFQNIFNLSDILCIFFEYFAYTVKLIIFHYEKQNVVSLSRKLQEPLLKSFEEHQKVFVKDVIKRIAFIGNFFKLCCILTISFLGLRPFIEDKVFPTPFSFFQEGFMWYVTYVFQVISLAIGIWNHSALDTLCVGYMGIALAELDILIDKITYFADRRGRTGENIEKYLHSCCEHHNKIIELVKNIEDVFTKGILMQYFCSIIVICNTGFHMLMTPLLSAQFMTFLMYFGTVMTELAMYCWFGNEIILKSSEIGNACYSSKWYEFDKVVNKIIFLIMERSKRPLTISAYKFSILSLSAYLTIIQWSYSYFTLLRRVYMRD